MAKKAEEIVADSGDTAAEPVKQIGIKITTGGAVPARFIPCDDFRDAASVLAEIENARISFIHVNYPDGGVIINVAQIVYAEIVEQ